jgi:hypothetical protein
MSTAREGDDSVAEPELGPEARMGAAMKAAREARGLSRRAFASQIYMSHSNLAEYENGHRLAPAHVVEAYESQLGLAAGSLLSQWEQARVELYGEMRDRRPRWVPPVVARDAVDLPGEPHPAGPPGRPASWLFTGKAAVIFAACLVAVTGIVWWSYVRPPRHASPVAASGFAKTCNKPGPTVTDYAGVKRSTVFCDTFMASNTYALADESSAPQGYLPKGSNWFACQREGKETPITYNHNGTANRNTWWLLTEGTEDVAKDGHKGWGWIPATVVAQGGNYQSIPGVPFC